MTHRLVAVCAFPQSPPHSATARAGRWRARRESPQRLVPTSHRALARWLPSSATIHTCLSKRSHPLSCVRLLPLPLPRPLIGRSPRPPRLPHPDNLQADKLPPDRLSLQDAHPAQPLIVRLSCSARAPLAVAAVSFRARAPSRVPITSLLPSGAHPYKAGYCAICPPPPPHFRRRLAVSPPP
jgi:hypothetical protein